MIKWTFCYEENSIVAQVHTVEEDQEIARIITGKSDRAASEFLYLKLQNGHDCFFNFKVAKLITREEVVEEPITLPTPASQPLNEPLMTEQELKDTYGSVPEVV